MAKPYTEAIDTERVYNCVVCRKVLTRWHVPSETDMPEAPVCSAACLERFNVVVVVPPLPSAPLQENSSDVSGAELVSTGTVSE